MKSKADFTLYSPSEFRRAANARRMRRFDLGVMALLILVCMGYIMAAFAYHTDGRPVEGTKACVAARQAFVDQGLISWKSRGPNDSYGKYLGDMELAQCKAASLAGYMGW